MENKPALVVVVMGVSGSGKSSLGSALADMQGWDFQEGDDLHPQANIDKMRSGKPLDDIDRAPWLDHIAAWITSQLRHQRNGVITCSALKRAYRDRLNLAGSGVCFVYIHVARDELLRRLQHRDHFMPASLLDSQLQTLEIPDNAENILVVRGEDPLEMTLTRITRWIAEKPHGSD